MALNLDKGGKLNLSKESASKVFSIGLGWDTPNSGMTEAQVKALDENKRYDLDVMALILDKDGKTLSDDHIAMYRHEQDPEKALTHSGDNETGVGEGDDETIIADTTKLTEDAAQIVFLVNMHKGVVKNQNFGQVNNAYAKLYEGADKIKELAKMDLTEDFSMDTQVVFCRIYKHNGEWKFEATMAGKGKVTLADTLESYGYHFEASSPRI